jgi:hypothetical protein
MRWDRNKAVHRYMPVHRCTGTKYHDFQKVKLGKAKSINLNFRPMEAKGEQLSKDHSFSRTRPQVSPGPQTEKVTHQTKQKGIK